MTECEKCDLCGLSFIEITLSLPCSLYFDSSLTALVETEMLQSCEGNKSSKPKLWRSMFRLHIGPLQMIQSLSHSVCLSWMDTLFLLA